MSTKSPPTTIPLNQFLNNEYYGSYDIRTCFGKLNIEKFSIDQIDLIIKKIFVDGFARSARNIIRTNIFLNIWEFSGILTTITKYHTISEKSMDIIFDSIKKNKERGKHNSFYIDWIKTMESKGYVLSLERQELMKKWGYVQNVTNQLKNKKLTFNQFKKCFVGNDNLMDLLNDSQLLESVIKNSKFSVDKTLFNFFFNKTSEMYDAYIRNFLHYNKKPDDFFIQPKFKTLLVTNLINTFKNFGYNLSLTECICCLNHSSCDLSHFLVDNNNNFIKKSNQSEKANILISDKIKVLDELIKIFEEEYDVMTILNTGLLTTNKNFCTHLVKTNKIQLVNKNIGIKCSIIFHCLPLLNYYINKKFIATEEHVLLLLHSFCKQYDWTNLNINEYCDFGNALCNDFVQSLKTMIISGTIITTKLIEPFLYIHYIQPDLKLIDIVDLCKSITPEQMEKIKNDTNIAFKKLKNFYDNSLNESKTSVKIDFVDICKNKKLCEILEYIDMNNTQITPHMYTFLSINKHLSVLEYFIDNHNFKPTLYNIMIESNYFSRFIMLSRFYPEVIENKHFEPTNNINTINTVNTTNIVNKTISEAVEQTNIQTTTQTIQIESDSNNSTNSTKPKKSKKIVTKVKKSDNSIDLTKSKLVDMNDFTDSELVDF